MFSVNFHVNEEYFPQLSRLPWQQPIELWEELGVKSLKIKSGASRHPIVFVESDGVRFAIKQLSRSGAEREITNYLEILKLGVSALEPIGYVAREEDPIPFASQVGLQFEENVVSHTVTLLAEKVLPDSQLYRRAFKFENRKRIWDAVVELFVSLHINGIYWGDASLANALIHFTTEEIPHVGKRTILKAILADAETVEIHGSLSDGLRRADLDFFFESMQWVNEDLRASGVLREELATQQDQDYVRQQYTLRLGVRLKEREFERDTLLKVQKLIGVVSLPVYIDILRQHIEEHKWYLSEARRLELSLPEAADDWYRNVFLPICDLFREMDVLEHFPGKTASDLYVEIMTNKYYLSRQLGRDIGMIHAMRDYSGKFGVEGGSFAKTFKRLSQTMLKILGWKEAMLEQK